MHRYINAIRDFLHSWWARNYVTWRWHFKSNGRRHQLPGALIVSLTSHPPRFDTLIHTLRSLLRQSVKADYIILWVAYSDFPLLPQSVIELQKAGLEIRATNDMKSYTKIIPALDAFPDDFICTADDDIYYWPTWLEELIEGVNFKDDTVTCHRAHEITFDSQGSFRPYCQWIVDTRVRGERRYLFPTGAGGILYPPGILAHTAEDRKACLSLCPHADDVWLYWMGRRNGANYKTTRRRRRIISWRGSQTVGLWRLNRLKGGNDEQIRKMVGRYGYPHVSVSEANRT